MGTRHTEQQTNIMECTEVGTRHTEQQTNIIECTEVGTRHTGQQSNILECTEVGTRHTKQQTNIMGCPIVTVRVRFQTFCLMIHFESQKKETKVLQQKMQKKLNNHLTEEKLNRIKLT